MELPEMNEMVTVCPGHVLCIPNLRFIMLYVYEQGDLLGLHSACVIFLPPLVKPVFGGWWPWRGWRSEMAGQEGVSGSLVFWWHQSSRKDFRLNKQQQRGPNMRNFH